MKRAAILVTSLLFLSVAARAQETAPPLPAPDANMISTVIEVVSRIMTPCEESASLTAVKANRHKGRLLRKYNRWQRRARITMHQYEALSAELLGISVMELRQMQMLYR